MIKVQCIICDTEVFIDQNTLEAKRLRNDPMHTFMCDECKVVWIHQNNVIKQQPSTIDNLFVQTYTSFKPKSKI